MHSVCYKIWSKYEQVNEKLIHESVPTKLWVKVGDILWSNTSSPSWIKHIESGLEPFFQNEWNICQQQKYSFAKNSNAVAKNKAKNGRRFTVPSKVAIPGVDQPRTVPGCLVSMPVPPPGLVTGWPLDSYFLSCLIICTRKDKSHNQEELF